uniref:PUM-HD domain-containing protein n=1 Tax=Parastrongyloides trichosuri TaxID=131310 RepID=A0A0N4ZVA0_PARTI
MNYSMHGNEFIYNSNPNRLHPLVYPTSHSSTVKSPILKNQGRSLSARECTSPRSIDSLSPANYYLTTRSFESTESDDHNYLSVYSSDYNYNNSRKTSKHFYRKHSSPNRFSNNSKCTLPISYLPGVGNVSPRILPTSPKDFSSSYDIKRPSELNLFGYNSFEDNNSKVREKYSLSSNSNFLYPSSNNRMMRSTSCKSTPNRLRSASPLNESLKNNHGSQFPSTSDLNVIDFLYNVRSFDDEGATIPVTEGNNEPQQSQKISSSLFLKRATRSLKMGQKESRLQKSESELATGFSNSFDNSYLETNKMIEKTQNNKKHISNTSRTNSTNSDDSYIMENNKSTIKAGSSGSLNIFTKNNKIKKNNDKRVQNGIRSSSATSKAATSKRNASPPRLTTLKRLVPISASSQEIIRYCMENARGDIATRIVSRMAHKREDFATFVTNLTSDQLNEFTGALRDYLNQVLKHVHSAEKIREVSMQFGILQVSRREWGFKADFFACMANSITTECVFLDGAAHQPTEAIEAWAELVELMFTNIREGYYQQIRYLRRRSQCFSGYFSHSQDVSSSVDNHSDNINYSDQSTEKLLSNDSGYGKLLQEGREERNRHPWTMQRQMSESGCYGERPINPRTRYHYNATSTSPIEPVMSPGVIINIKN